MITRNSSGTLVIRNIIFSGFMKLNNSVTIGKKIEFDDFAVGILSLITFYNVILFIILQILVAVATLVIAVLLPELGVISGKNAETLTWVFIISADALLIIILARLSWKRFLQEVENVRFEGSQNSHKVPGDASIAFSESQLELIFGITAIAALAWCFLLGLTSLSFQIVLLVIEGFALLFLLIFMAIRFMATRKIRLTALVCLILTNISFWGILKSVKI